MPPAGRGMIPLHPAPHDFTDTCSNHLVCVCRTAKNQRLPFNGEPFLCAAEGTNRVHLPRAGGILPPAGCAASGKMKKRRRRKTAFSHGVFYFIAPVAKHISISQLFTKIILHQLVCIAHSPGIMLLKGKRIYPEWLSWKGRGQAVLWPQRMVHPQYPPRLHALSPTIL